MDVVFFKDTDGSVPVMDWLDEVVARRDLRIAAKCRVRIELLQDQGEKLRRPYADYLQDGIYELRIAFGTVNYRILYFFSGSEAVIVLAHGLTKEAEIPPRDIQIAVKRRELFEGDPKRYTYHE